MKTENLTAVYFLGSDGHCGVRRLSGKNVEQLAEEIRQMVGGRFMFLPAAISDVNVLVHYEHRRLKLPKNPLIGGVQGNAVLLRRVRNNPYKLQGFDESQLKRLDSIFSEKKRKLMVSNVSTSVQSEEATK